MRRDNQRIDFSPGRNIAAPGWALFCVSCLCWGYYSVADRFGYYALSREDSWVENLTVVWFFLSALALLAAALAEGSPWRRGLYVLAGLAFLFVAGEEINWGQRIFGFETPESLMSFNPLLEFNIHNADVFLFSGSLHLGAQGAIAGLSIVTCAAFFAGKDRLWGIPLPSILLILALMIAMVAPLYTDMDLRLILDLPTLLTFSRELTLTALLAVFILLSGQIKLFLAAATTAVLLVAAAYANSFAVAEGFNQLSEMREYQIGFIALLYSLQLLLAQERARHKLAAIFAGFKPPNPASRPNYMRSPWTMVCLGIIAASIGLGIYTYTQFRAELAAYKEKYNEITSLEPSIQSDFDVYRIGNELIYLKEPCYRPDIADKFFLHIIPADLNDLPTFSRRQGFDSLLFDGPANFRFFDRKCLAVIDVLPDYDIIQILTGQFQGQTDLWRAGFAFPDAGDQAADLAERYRAIRAAEPVIQSRFEVYIIGNELTYFKESCDRQELDNPFFLHVTPANPDDLPGHRRPYGFDNLDFYGFGIFGDLDGNCLASIRLPDYGIAKIATGQYISGGGRIWEGDFAPP